ncbi:MAG: bile acid:sodium symporter family protein [Bacteroidales bacterium]
MTKRKPLIRNAALITAVTGLLLLGIAAVTVFTYRVGLLGLLFAGALYVMVHSKLSGFSFTAWVLVCVGFALAYPQLLHQWGGFELTLLIVPLTQLIMFGMGTTLSLKDFSRILIAPWPVLLGVILQFGIMPVTGFIIATSFGFEGELAAGIVLIGSVSGGVASNLMAFIAGANVALSVTMTVVSTFVAPLMTPLLMGVFAGRFIPIDTLAMMIGVINIIVVPVIAGLLAHSLLYSPRPWARQTSWLLIITLTSAALVTAALIVSPGSLGVLAPLRNGVILGGVLLSVVALSKLVVSVWLHRPNTWIDKALPLVSMAGICVILAIIIAQTHDVLMEAGLMLVLAAVVHNASGYSFGYWGARGFGALLGRLGYRFGLRETTASLIDEANCRTVAFEVGMQNGGMATGLAMDVLKSHVAALPPNIFGTWMNISGSVLANWWKKKRIQRTAQTG